MKYINYANSPELNYIFINESKSVRGLIANHNPDQLHHVVSSAKLRQDAISTQIEELLIEYEKYRALESVAQHLIHEKSEQDLELS